MKDMPGGCEVYLVVDGRVVTCFRMGLPPGMLVDEITSGSRRFKRFGSGQPLQAVVRDRQVWIWPAAQVNPLELEAGSGISITAIRESNNLTERQQQVLEGLFCGQTLAEIGYRLGIRVRSVRHHVDALKRRYRAVSLSELVARALAANQALSTPPQGGPGAGRRSDHPKKH
jgi:DNA-binding CsgD family transcriptional regulator